MIKVGDLIKYTVGHLGLNVIGVVTCVNDDGGTLLIDTVYGDSRWVVTSGCEVLA